MIVARRFAASLRRRRAEGCAASVLRAMSCVPLNRPRETRSGPTPPSPRSRADSCATTQSLTVPLWHAGLKQGHITKATTTTTTNTMITT